MKRGEVAEVIWYYTDMTGSKQRPAVVVQADFLVQITSTRHGIPGTEVLLRPGGRDGVGPHRACVASCMNAVTYDQARAIATIGVLSDEAMCEIEVCLKKVLNLP